MKQMLFFIVNNEHHIITQDLILDKILHDEYDYLYSLCNHVEQNINNSIIFYTSLLNLLICNPKIIENNDFNEFEKINDRYDFEYEISIKSIHFMENLLDKNLSNKSNKTKILECLKTLIFYVSKINRNIFYDLSKVFIDKEKKMKYLAFSNPNYNFV